MTAEAILKKIKDEDIKYVDLRFTDPRGKWQHVTMDRSMADEDLFAEGTMFDGSSISGWKAINESDMVLMPDPGTAVLDPFTAQKTLVVFCDILEPTTKEAYNRDPRSIAKRAEAHLKASGLGDVAYFGPEAEFFVFDDVRWSTEQNDTSFMIDSAEGPYNSATFFDGGNMGHRPGPKGGYFPVPPVDSGQDLRSEMLSVMTEMGLEPEKHHHEVAPSQHELGMRFSPLTRMADKMQSYKYVVQMVAAAYGKTATFMPKPIYQDNGSGMHIHQSIWKDGSPAFAGDQYADLSETCLYYIGGIMKHAKALNAFANPSTNSYKRLVPGFEAPTLVAYSSRNRSAAIRVPWVASPNGKRIETRFPDAMANPYLVFAAMLMAGLDGIENKIHPGDAMEKDLYELPEAELKDIPRLCGSLEEAMNALDQDRAFLTKGGVFSDDMLDGYMDLKREEITRYRSMPHPVEFDMYYSA